MGTAEDVLKEEKPKLGRPLQYSPAMCDILDTLHGANTVQEMADHLKVDPRTIYDWMQRFDAFSRAVARARDRADDRMVSATYASGLNGDNKAQRFWLGNRRPTEWREKVEHQVTGTAPAFVFVLEGKREELGSAPRQVEGEVIETKPLNQTPDSDEVEHASD